MKFFVGHFLIAWIVLFVAFQANALESWQCDENGCAAAIAPIEHFGRDAWKLTDGKTEAIIVPSLGRLMSFKRVGGQNWLWDNSAVAATAKDAWKNWGGDKTWLAPQARWTKLGSENGWPPPREWDGAPFQSQILSGGKLKIWGPVSDATGLRISRVFYHDENGDFVVEQTISKVAGAPVEVSIWDVAQLSGGNISAVFLPRAQNSDYPNGIRWLDGEQNIDAQVVPSAYLPQLVQVNIGGTDDSYKIGTDAPRAAIAAMRGNDALVLNSARPDGIYPDGENNENGLPVEFYSARNAKSSYFELELLSPLLQLKSGERETHVVRWSVHALPTADANDANVHAAIDKLLG